LWTTSLAGVGGQSSSYGPGADNSKKSMLDLEREKTMTTLWNATSAKPTASSFTAMPAGTKPLNKTQNIFDDLLG
jgi:hypothetical protein